LAALIAAVLARSARVGVRVGHDLAGDDAIGFGPELIGQRLRADEGHVVERAAEAGLARRADEPRNLAEALICTIASGLAGTRACTAAATSTLLRSTVATATGFSPWPSAPW
jgi:hypothetical protein